MAKAQAIPSNSAESDAEDFDWQTGRHRTRQRVPSIDLDWPEGTAQRRAAFAMWHETAMQLIKLGGMSYRTIGVFWRFVHWKSGSLFPSNVTLAAFAGRCSERTVTRELAAYEAAGIIRIALRRRQKRNGAWHTVRVIVLTIPEKLPKGIVLAAEGDGDDENDEVSLDNSGPSRTAVCIDSSGLGQVDSSGLVTLDGTREEEGRSDEAA